MTDEVFNKLLEEVRAEVGTYLDAQLAKSSTDDSPDSESSGSSGPTEPDGKPDEPQAAPKKEEASASPPSDGPPSDGPPAEASAGPPGDPAADPSAAPAGDPAADGAIQPAPTVEALQAEYSVLDDEELKLHYLACKGAIMARLAPPAADPMAAGAAPAAPGLGAPAPGPAAPALGSPAPAAPAPAPMAPPAPAAPLDPTAMSPAPTASPGAPSTSPPDPTLMRSAKDDELDSLKKSVAELAAMVAGQIKPVAKSAQFNYEVTDQKPVVDPKAVEKQLFKALEDGKFTKSERDQVFAFACNKLTLDQVAHLLK